MYNKTPGASRYGDTMMNYYSYNESLCPNLINSCSARDYNYPGGYYGVDKVRSRAHRRNEKSKRSLLNVWIRDASAPIYVESAEPNELPVTIPMRSRLFTCGLHDSLQAYGVNLSSTIAPVTTLAPDSHSSLKWSVFS